MFQELSLRAQTSAKRLSSGSIRPTFCLGLYGVVSPCLLTIGKVDCGLQNCLENVDVREYS